MNKKQEVLPKIKNSKGKTRIDSVQGAEEHFEKRFASFNKICNDAK